MRDTVGLGGMKSAIFRRPHASCSHQKISTLLVCSTKVYEALNCIAKNQRQQQLLCRNLLYKLFSRPFDLNGALLYALSVLRHTYDPHHDVLPGTFPFRLTSLIVEITSQYPNRRLIQHVSRPAAVEYPLFFAKGPQPPSQVHRVWATVYCPPSRASYLVRQQVLPTGRGEGRRPEG